jgi:hypothetical protein
VRSAGSRRRGDAKTTGMATRNISGADGDGGMTVVTAIVRVVV